MVEFLLSLWALPVLVGASMVAWWPNVGVQILIQDPESLDLHYSYCNQGYSVAFPIEEPLKLPVTSKPRAGTALAGAGWWDGTTTWVRERSHPSTITH